MIKKILKYLKFRFFLYFFAMVAGWPCVFYLMGWIPNYKVNYYVLFVIAGAYALGKNMISHVPPTIKNMIYLQIFVWGFYSVIYFDAAYFTRIFLLLTTLFLLGAQLHFKDKLEFVKAYNFWLLFQAVAGCIGFVLVLGGALQPLSYFIEMDGRTGAFYGFFTTNAIFDGFIRNAGFYDEPGAMAFWGMNALVMNKLYVNNKKVEYLLVIGLISTLSLAYWIQLAIYLFFFYKTQRIKLLFGGLLVFSIMKGLASIDEGIDTAIFGRMKVDKQTGQLEGDNRTILMERCMRIFQSSPIIGVGATNLVTKVSAKEGFVGANFFANWASDGIVGAFITYVPLLYLFFLGRYKKKYLYCSVILLVGYQQRPYTETQLLYPLVQYTILMFAYIEVHRPKLLIKDRRDV